MICMEKAKKDKTKTEVKPIKYDVSKLEKVFQLSDTEVIANAIRDLLIRDKEQ